MRENIEELAQLDQASVMSGGDVVLSVCCHANVAFESNSVCVVRQHACNYRAGVADLIFGELLESLYNPIEYPILTFAYSHFLSRRLGQGLYRERFPSFAIVSASPRSHY